MLLLGEVNLLVNNAGVGLAKLSWEHTTKDWDWVLGVNMWSIIHANRYFIPRMLKQVRKISFFFQIMLFS